MRDLPPPAPRPCLLTRRLEGGPQDARPAWIVLHDRHDDIAGARALAQDYLPPATPHLLVRSARMQTRGSLAPPRGPFWFIGPLTRPELSTLGDGLEQLERLLTDIGAPQIALLAKGEGAVVALCLALLRPHDISALHLIDPVVPENLHRMPLPFPSAAQVKITTNDGAMVAPLQQVFPHADVSFAGL